MVEWHNEGLTPDDIQKIIREGRDKNDNTTFNDYGDYINYISKDNNRIINQYNDHDHSKCAPNEETMKAIEEAMDDVFVSSVDGSESTLREILDKLGSDYDEDGIPYWDKNA
jgi:hypothetical protein